MPGWRGRGCVGSLVYEFPEYILVSPPGQPVDEPVVLVLLYWASVNGDPAEYFFFLAAGLAGDQVADRKRSNRGVCVCVRWYLTGGQRVETENEGPKEEEESQEEEVVTSQTSSRRGRKSKKTRKE